MEDNHFKILEFLSRQTGPISYLDFPEEIQEDFRYRDTPLKDGSLLHELSLQLTRSKKWVDLTHPHKFTITETGRNALEREVKIREELKKEKDLASQVRDLDLLTKKFIYKARYLPFIFSGLAIAISTCAYFKSREKIPPEKPPAKQGIKVETKKTPLPAQNYPLKTGPK